MEAQRSIERIDTVVIGAGQAGLSAGYYLAKRGRPFVILDADDRIGDHWRNHWDSLRLYSPARFDSLPGMRFPAPSYHYPTGREMGDYLERYATAFDLPVLSGTRVDRVEPVPGPAGGYLVTAGDRRYHAGQVIVASGPFNTPNVPPFADRLDPAIRQLHSSQYRNPSQLQPGAVLVVGVSHSGADIAYETATTHRTLLAGRARGEVPFAVVDTWRARIGWPVVTFVQGHVITVRTPIGRKVARAIRTGGAPLLRVRSVDLARAGVERHEQRVAAVSDSGRPTLEDGTDLDVANVIWCTGFRRDYGWVEVPGFTDADGWPKGYRGVADAPGLYFLGVPLQFAFTSMLVGGAGRDAKYVVDRIAERVASAATSRHAVEAAA